MLQSLSAHKMLSVVATHGFNISHLSDVSVTQLRLYIDWGQANSLVLLEREFSCSKRSNGVTQ